MPLLPPSFEVAFPELKRLLDSPGKSKVAPELVVLVRQFLELWPFDESWYLTTYPDIVKAIRDGRFKSARLHYLNFGYFECRLPCQPDVDDDWYLKQYRDVAKGIAAGKFKNPTQHYLEFGYREGREPSASEAAARSAKTKEADALTQSSLPRGR
jgi:hypothetical protein